MILIALSVATALTIATPPAISPPGGTQLPMPNFYSQPARCGPMHDEVLRRIRTATRGRQGMVQYAVLRVVDGCGVPAPVGYHQDYLAPGAADNPPPAVTREGEPSNRR
jgi:hypothetical protein